MGRLTKPQRRTLRQIESGLTIPSIQFRTGDSLRKMGLVERQTLYIVKRVYAREDGEHLQFECPHEPVVWHEWFITEAGRRALDDQTEPEKIEEILRARSALASKEGGK